MIRAPNRDDISDLARIHVQAWQETYRGLIPDQEITKRDFAYREALWARLLCDDRLRTAYAPGIGFAQMGAQRDVGFAEQGYPEELFSFYVLAAHHGQGYGRDLLRAVVRDVPFTALMVSGNERAGRFYRASGAVLLDRRKVQEGDLTFVEDAFGWTPPFQW